MKWPIILAVGLGIFLIARKGFGMSGDILTQMAPAFLGKLSQAKRANAVTIASMFADAGLSQRAAAAAIVNAWAESGLNAPAAGDGGHSIGLFQLNDNGGAGAGLTVAFREDPRNNTKTILDREVLTSRGKKFRERDKEGAGVAELADIFCVAFERPKDSEAKGKARGASAKNIFPTM